MSPNQVIIPVAVVLVACGLVATWLVSAAAKSTAENPHASPQALASHPAPAAPAQSPTSSSSPSSAAVLAEALSRIDPKTTTASPPPTTSGTPQPMITREHSYTAPAKTTGAAAGLTTFLRDVEGISVVNASEEWVCIAHGGLVTLIQPKFRGHLDRIDRLLCFEYYQLRPELKAPERRLELLEFLFTLNKNDWCQFSIDEKGDLVRFWSLAFDRNLTEEYLLRVLTSDREGFTYVVASQKDVFTRFTTLLDHAHARP